MLGRLFNGRSVEQMDPQAGSTRSNSAPSGNSLSTKMMTMNLSSISDIKTSPFPNDDSYSKTILYGTPNQLNFTPLHPYSFRMVLVQDKGEIINRDNHKVLYDSSRDHHFDDPVAKKCDYRHEISELLDFMFGNPIHQDFHYRGRVKLHVLSSLPGLQKSVLLSTQFEHSKLNFAIAVVIPVNQEQLSQCIIPNWKQLIHHIALIKPRNYLDIAILFKQAIISLQNLVSIPRILLGITQFDSIFQDWCFEVNNWIEIKDGARLGCIGTKFLQSLLAVVNGIKDDISLANSNNVVRVVIMAINPIVVQKLIFIISGILPYNPELKISSSASNIDTTLEDATQGIQRHNPKRDEPVSPQYIATTRGSPSTPSIISKGWEIPSITPSRSTATTTTMTPISRPSMIQPMASSSSVAQLSSSLQSHNSFSSSLSRGFHMLQNWKNSMDSTSSSMTNSIHGYHTPSPKMEYDEYPWSTTTATTTTPCQQPLPNSLPRTMSSFDLTQNMGKLKRVMPKLPHIGRNVVNVMSVGDSCSPLTKSERLNEYRNELLQLMDNSTSCITTSLEYDPIKSVSVVNVQYDDLTSEYEHERRRTVALEPLCGYISEFTPCFKLQACPPSQDLETKIINTMRNDLLEANCEETRTIFVSLRAREIREFVINKSIDNLGTYKPTIRRLYTNGKPSSYVDRAAFDKVSKVLDSVGDCDGSQESMQRVRTLLSQI
ncbi:hypothetical protein BN1211_4698 [Cyberlindnera jadinii]|uniref:Protein LST4 n=1 Tax=Cyberlindnera jadinii (strain ATCC 18201 / CBS 1600 / BCRC 20928 / JCM 3617 / NBRC 0987 / NRRL Y-1542) TaxID=983966 RepID=A0A0H5C7C1_CYBJN|nr:hypothetical protein BN1211_4698 [Cyberlindnera jadinii]